MNFYESSSKIQYYISIFFFVFQAANQITKLEGLENLEHLATLHLRDNQLEDLDGFSESLKNLQYINLRYRSSYNIYRHLHCTGVPVIY